MTTREGSRASRYGAKDAGSFGRAVSSALLTVDLFRPGFPPRPSVPAGSRRDVLQRQWFTLIQREPLHTRRDQGKLQYRCS
jgi:hypothetical protein